MVTDDKAEIIVLQPYASDYSEFQTSGAFIGNRTKLFETFGNLDLDDERAVTGFLQQRVWTMIIYSVPSSKVAEFRGNYGSGDEPLEAELRRHEPITVMANKQLRDIIAGFPDDAPVYVESYVPFAGTDRDNRSGMLVHVEAMRSEIYGITVNLWSAERPSPRARHNVQVMRRAVQECLSELDQMVGEMSIKDSGRFDETTHKLRERLAGMLALLERR